jgi:hypothetical protein
MKLTRSYRARCWTVEFGTSEAPSGLPPGAALHTPWTMDADAACVITWARERFGIYSAPEVVIEPVGGGASPECTQDPPEPER